MVRQDDALRWIFLIINVVVAPVLARMNGISRAVGFCGSRCGALRDVSPNASLQIYAVDENGGSEIECGW